MRGIWERAAAFLRRPIVPGARTRVGDLALITWFAALSAFSILSSILENAFGWDALIYSHAARALLAGENPWGPAGATALYAGPPPGLLPYLPFAAVPDPIVAGAWVVIAGACAIYVVRHLGLPAWWLLFPPVVVAILAGSTALPVIALLVRGGALAEGIGVAFRPYAAVPLAVLGRWRGTLAAAAIVIVTAPFLDWPRYLADFAGITATLAEQSKGGQSAAVVPWLIPVAAICVLLLGRKRAAWLIVPALWPFTQGYYGVIALPVVAGVPFVALAMAINNLPIIYPGVIVVGLVAQVVAERIGRREAVLNSAGLATSPVGGR
jgi:hypothetical protein